MIIPYKTRYIGGKMTHIIRNLHTTILYFRFFDLCWESFSDFNSRCRVPAMIVNTRKRGAVSLPFRKHLHHLFTTQISRWAFGTYQLPYLHGDRGTGARSLVRGVRSPTYLHKIFRELGRLDHNQKRFPRSYHTVRQQSARESHHFTDSIACGVIGLYALHSILLSHGYSGLTRYLAVKNQYR